MKALASAIAIVSLAWLAAAEPPAAPAGREKSPQEREKAFGGRYAILIERNIFSRNRPQRYVPLYTDPNRDRGEKKIVPQSEETSYVLTGVIREDGKYAAFIENSRTGTTIKAKVGDPVARGKITAIHLDGVTYEMEGKSLALQVGKTLAGEKPDSRTERSEKIASEDGRSSGDRDRDRDRDRERRGSGGSKATAEPAGEKSAEPAAESSSTEDIIARMKKRREMEMKK
jgi:hypothetical protein